MSTSKELDDDLNSGIVTKSIPKEQPLHNPVILNSAHLRAKVTDMYAAQRALAGRIEMEIGASVKSKGKGKRADKNGSSICHHSWNKRLHSNEWRYANNARLTQAARVQERPVAPTNRNSLNMQ